MNKRIQLFKSHMFFTMKNKLLVLTMDVFFSYFYFIFVFSVLIYVGWIDFLQWCLDKQISLHRYLVEYLLQLNAHQFSGGLWLVGGAFVYGVVHAVGPGHGKFIMTTYLSSNKESLLAARMLSFLGSLLQGISAIAFVYIFAIGFNLASGDLSQSRWYIEKISAVLIGLLGCRFIYCNAKTLFSASRSGVSIAHAGCGCAHAVVATTTHQNIWKTRLGIVLAVGLRPCSGAILILLFANAIGIVRWGILAVLAMSVGTALSVMLLAQAVQWLRYNTVSSFADTASRLQWLAPLVKIAGGAALLIFALILFFTVIPVSPNGDFITMGC